MKFDEDEMSWLRGGYESAVSEVEALKDQSQLLRNNLAVLEKQKSDLKESYDLAIEQVGNMLIQLDFLRRKLRTTSSLCSTVAYLLRH